jgi:hypothetical protein
MQQFDPAAATAAYLAQMSPTAHARATAYTQGGHWLLLWAWLVSVLVAWLVIRSGVLTRIAATIQRRRQRLVLTSFVVTLCFLLLDWVMELPWDIYAHWWREKSYGLTSQPLPGYVIQQAVSNAIGSVVLALFAIALYALLRRAPKTWWAWGGGIYASFNAVNSAYATLDDIQLSDPTVGVLLTMLHHNFEHVEAAILAIVTGHGSSAEVVARASNEASITILYILAGDSMDRLRAHFDDYFSTVDGQVRKWEATIRDLPDSEQAIHLEFANRRRAANTLIRTRIAQMFGEPREHWPKKISDRFGEVGLALDYRTVYARMSSETHADAEETVRYIIGKLRRNSGSSGECRVRVSH